MLAKVIVGVGAVCLAVAGQQASARVTVQHVDSLERIYPDRPSLSLGHDGRNTR